MLLSTLLWCVGAWDESGEGEWWATVQVRYRAFGVWNWLMPQIATEIRKPQGDDFNSVRSLHSLCTLSNSTL